MPNMALQLTRCRAQLSFGVSPKKIMLNRILLPVIFMSFFLTSCMSDSQKVQQQSFPTMYNEKSSYAINLRKWVFDAFPKDTIVLDHSMKKAWDGSEVESWLFRSKTGFSETKKRINLPNSVYMLSEAAYKSLIIRINVRKSNYQIDPDKFDMSRKLWDIDFESKLEKTGVKGTIFPYLNEEILLIERISL